MNKVHLTQEEWTDMFKVGILRTNHVLCMYHLTMSTGMADPASSWSTKCDKVLKWPAAWRIEYASPGLRQGYALAVWQVFVEGGLYMPCVR